MVSKQAVTDHYIILHNTARKVTLFSKKGDRAGRVILLASNTNNHTRGELNGLSLRGRPILFITRMMTYRPNSACKESSVR